MKNKRNVLITGLCALALGVCGTVFGQAPVITSFSQNGVLVCSNLLAGSTGAVEWASSLAGPWTNNWAELSSVVADSNGMISVSVPMFYRVRGVAAPTNTPPPAGMVLMPAGSFTMGDVAYNNLDGDAAPINVYVSAFYMDQYDVAYALWQQVYNWAISHGYSFLNLAAGKAANHPVQSIDWYDCVKWCNARSEMGGLTPAYFTDASQTVVYRTGDLDLGNACVNWQKGYRLPTEAEWEKAARGGLSGQRFPWGATISESQANYFGDPIEYSYDWGPVGENTNFDTWPIPYTSPVGSFAANGYGLYDMAGNVWQWCWDWYGTPYVGGSNPSGPTSGSNRVWRGGSWCYFAPDCRVANRFSGGPGNPEPGGKGSYLGFRSVLPSGQP